MKDKARGTATLILRDQTFTVPAGITVREAIRHVGLVPESVLPTRDGELIPEDERLQDGDVIRLVAVISGGWA